MGRPVSCPRQAILQSSPGSDLVRLSRVCQSAGPGGGGVDLGYLNPFRNERVEKDLVRMRQLEERLSREGRAQLESVDAADLKIPAAMRKAWMKVS